MDYAINELEQKTLNATRELAQKKMKPLRAEMDRKEQFSKEMYEEFRKAGMFGLWLPKQYGGLGGGITCLAMAFEEFSRVCAGLALTPGTSALGAIPMFLAATPEQRERWCYDLASGKKLWAFALTEPEAGSDATALKTTAIKDGDFYVVNGTKHFISTGKEADFYTVAVNTNPSRGARGISLLVIEKGMPGFTFGKKEEKMGIRTNPTYELIFENVRVPKENLLGSEGRGLLYVQETLDYSRPGVAAQAVGIAQGALDETIPYLRTRKQFGQPIITFQALAHKVAELAAKTEAGRALVYSLTHRMDEELLPAVKAALENGTTVHDELKKIKGGRWTKYSAMAKLFCANTAMEVADECVTLCGGVAYMRDFPLEKYMRDAKVTQIYEGTVHIQKNEIATALMKEYATATAATNPPAQTIPLEELLRGYCKKYASSDKHKDSLADLSQAEVIVAGGRGVGKKEGFELLQKLADRLGGLVAGTRPPADNGWIDTGNQIGITGKTVKPKLYIACGISGQQHHMAGVKADVIVAINKDPNAPIMKTANYAVEGDLYEVIPTLLGKLN
ncbi:MAG: FAD-binding protein [Elusimicrobiaceae bacterium]|nr:FAD-binding protein [Elusimicrobiaceae bacterium]